MAGAKHTTGINVEKRLTNLEERLEALFADFNERVETLEADQSYSQRLSDLEDQLHRIEKAITAQLGVRLS